MIYQTVRNYTFDPPLFKIHYIFPAYEDSIVMIALKKIGNDQLLHFDKNGILLFSLNFGQFVDTFCQTNDKQIIILRVELNQIWHVNIYKKTVTKYYYKFAIETSCQCYVDYFSDTKLLCVREHGDNQDKTLRLTYYTMPFIPVQPPFQVNQNIQNEDQEQVEMNRTQPPDFYIEPKASLVQQKLWAPTHSIRKVDAHSKYIWNQQRHFHYIKIHQAEIIDEKVVVNFLTISFSSLCGFYNIDYLRFSLLDLWYVRPGELLLYAITNKAGSRQRRQDEIPPKDSQTKNICFIWDIEKKTIRESLLAFDPKYQDLLIDVIGTPTLSMFRTFKYSKQAIMESPAYFVINRTEKIIRQEQWKCSHKYKYSVPDYLKDSISEAKYDNQDISNLAVRMIKKVSRAELSLFLLVNLETEPGKKGNIEDWDEDLLSDVINSIDYETSND